MNRPITGRTAVAGVVGRPVRHSLSPLIHNAWLDVAGIDAVYIALSPSEGRLGALVEGLRGGAMAGLNVTLPFKLEALAAADRVSDRAQRAGAANLLLFAADGSVEADNTDGEGLLGAFAAQASGFSAVAGPVVILGAGGAARGAAAAMLEAGAPEVRLVNRTRSRAETIAETLGGGVTVYGWDDGANALAGAKAVINATSLGLDGGKPPPIPLDRLPPEAVVMDMVYRPLETAFLAEARAAGRRTVDGLAMLIAQAAPSFEAFFGVRPPPDLDVRALAIAALEAGG